MVVWHHNMVGVALNLCHNDSCRTQFLAYVPVDRLYVHRNGEECGVVVESQPTIVDLFAGAGGFTLGFVQAGFTPIFAVEHDPDAAATYMANFGDHCDTRDIELVEDFPTADVVIGGPPCQGFSNLGTNDPDDPRNALTLQYMRAVEAIRPKVFAIENVPPLLKSDQGRTMVETAKRLGYQVKADILNAADFGAPQTRKRAIIIASRVGPVVFPPATHVDPNKSDNRRKHLLPWRTVREAIGDLPATPTDENLHWGRNPTALSQKRYRHVPPGGNRFDLPLELTPNCWIKKTKGGTDLFGRLWWDRPSVTIRTEFFKPEKGRYLHPEEHRPITHREAARLQGFPDDFVFVGSKISIAKQIGNAVPVDLSRAIAQAVRAMLGDNAHELGLSAYPLFRELVGEDTGD